MKTAQRLGPRTLIGLTVLLLGSTVAPASAQWRNRHPKLADYGMQIYPEGYDLPVLNAGPGDPAASPDRRSIAVSARGWIWLVDLASRQARRVTHSAGMDSRPAWSPDGKRLAFVRDDGSDTSIVEIDLASGAESVLVATPAIDLDPAYSSDGTSLYYSSAEEGGLDLWRLSLADGSKERLTQQRRIELRPQPAPGGAEIVYVHKSTNDTLSVLNTSDGSTRVLAEAPIASQMRPAVHPRGRSLVVNLPGPQGWKLWLMDLEGGPPIQLGRDASYPLTPTWSADGTQIYYVEADAQQRFHLWRVATRGGEAQDVSPIHWDWAEPTGRLVVKTFEAGKTPPVPARVNALDKDGHPAVPAEGQARFDLQNGIVYFYSSGLTVLEVPAGPVRLTATRGFATLPATATVSVEAGQTAVAELSFERIANPADDGWFSGDHHFHLNYGGPYELRPEDLLTAYQAEDLDVATPLMANLHTRVEDLEWWDWQRLASGPPLVAFGQEVRAHHLGHVGIIHVSSPFWPWFWGPGYPVYGRDDRPNADVLAHVHAQGGIAYYVHPVVTRNPFPEDRPPTGIPLEFVPDAILGDVDALEIACLWSDSLGTSEAWYRLLNVGVPIAPSAGTDAFPNFYRTMAVGTTRVYVQLDSPLNFDRYVESLRAGRSFVTTGPLLRFRVGDVGPGGVVKAERGAEVEWALTLTSAVAVEKAEIVVNGEVVWSGEGLGKAGERRYQGSVIVPEGGWVAARVHGGPTDWPVMDSYPFAHTAPLWFHGVGSRDASAARAAAKELLAWMDVAEPRLVRPYGDAPIPRLKQRFAEARSKLEAFSGSSDAR